MGELYDMQNVNYLSIKLLALLYEGDEYNFQKTWGEGCYRTQFHSEFFRLLTFPVVTFSLVK